MTEREPTRTDYRARIFRAYDRVSVVPCEELHRSAIERWGRAYRYYLRNWLPTDLDAGIVEVGCGTGRLLALLTTLGYRRISGVDISPVQVARSRQIVPEVFEQDALRYLGSAKGVFDVIIGLDIIEHFLKPEVMDFLELSYQALKPGGRLILQTPNAESPWVGEYRYGDFTHEVAFTPHALGGLLRLSGYTNVEFREAGPIPIGHSFVSSVRFALWQAIRAGLQFLNFVETGSAGSRIFTRNLLVSARKV